MPWMAVVLLLLSHALASAQDSIVVHFLHGSRPARHWKAEEPKWFGGKLGGHVGIGFAPDSVFHFVPSGKFHYVARRAPKHSRFVVSDTAGFWATLGGSTGALTTTSISVPIDSLQRATFTATKARYLAATPYDYAFLGMRCAAASNEILGKLGITRRRGYWGAIFGTFHPKMLRRRLLRGAMRHGWQVQHTTGSTHRVWQW